MTTGLQMGTEHCRAPAKPHIQIGRDTVTKRGCPARMSVEVTKTRLAAEIAQSTGLFAVPQVLSFDRETGTAVFERIVGAVPLGKADPSRDRELLELIGRSLAAVHAGLRLPDAVRIPLPAELASAQGGQVTLHGDVTGDNVLVCRDRRIPIFIDWQMTDVHGGAATTGTAYFDLAWFINYQFYEVRPLVAWKSAAPLAAKTFLEAYFSQADATATSIEGFWLYLQRFVDYKIASRRSQGIRTRLRLLPTHCRFRRFAKEGMCKTCAGALRSRDMLRG